jgi:hypothetical protein
MQRRREKMPKKALLIKFINAGIFPESRWSSDKMYDLNGKTKRKDAPVLQIPVKKFDWRHVSNVLHVLMGERPVPTIRKTLLKPVVIDTPCDERGRYESREMMTARKTVKDSWQTSKIAYFLGGAPVQIKGGLIYWARLERLIGETLLNDFIDTVKGITGEKNITRNISAHRAIEILHDNYDLSQVQHFCQKCIKAQRTALVNIINPKANKESITFHTGVGSKLNIQMVNSGPENIAKISGTIFIPLSDELLSRLSNGCGTATVLEGGLAYIEGIEEYSENLVFEAEPVIEAPIQRGGGA